jgi:hypothetical protein
MVLGLVIDGTSCSLTKCNPETRAQIASGVCLGIPAFSDVRVWLWACEWIRRRSDRVE